MRRSTGRITGSRKVRSRLKTRVMKMPMGLVSRRTKARKTAIWNHPFAVMSELLRAQQGVEEIDHHQGADSQKDDGLGRHRFSLLEAVAEGHVAQRQREESNRDGDKQQVLHNWLLAFSFQLLTLNFLELVS